MIYPISLAYGVIGYVFPDAAAITPYLEDPETGPTSLFCSTLAARLHCYVIAGYPERLRSDVFESQSSGEDLDIRKVGYNSAIMYGPGGQYVGGYRKTNLFTTDRPWALPGIPLFCASKQFAE